MLSADPLAITGLYAGPVASALMSSLLAEPAIPDPPRRVWRDWPVAGLISLAAVLEGLVRDDITWRPLTTVVVAALAATTLWRRTAPLAMMAVGFGPVVFLDQLAGVAGRPPVEFHASVFVLLLPYALFRWGSGRHVAWGTMIMFVTYVVVTATAWTGLGDAIGGAIALVVPAVLGLEVRQLTTSRARRIEDVKSQERAILARELHDTVAHHVSAIAIRAQAGRVVGAADPAGALEALAVIEHEASRTLAEMRGIVGALRGDESADYAPQPGMADITRFATVDGRPRVAVTLGPGLDDIGTAVGAALYRVTQEAITNSRRHAEGATLVTVAVAANSQAVTLTVDDDGHTHGPASAAGGGFGLVGMTERCQLLGGSLTAGPLRDGGWRVEATLPRRGVKS